ncbi:2OG-Fe(II) oxygenase family protein [Parasphingorhabdus sp.]|uniref:2OG-Fe(II) oxygenase n=1 Tax=Parasphingorhabdus sp. TaxID=2709688 RepID=UPI0030A173D8|nr:2OG-Fe(II) oxygenase [Sphingomonadales bacterium]
MTPVALFEINPELDRRALANKFSADGRLQIRNILSNQTARVIQEILIKQTPWGIGWQGGSNGPHGVRAEEIAALTNAQRHNIGETVNQAMIKGDYAFMFGQYRMLDAYLGQWNSGGPHDLLLEHLNAEPFLSLIREITGDDSLVKADGQATLYAPGHFLGVHDDSHVAEGWKIAYVLNLAIGDWRPEWGGYLNFLDDDGDVIAGFRPRFNALNLFRVPQRHEVTFVPPFAPSGRLAITGWLRDR